MSHNVTDSAEKLLREAMEMLNRYWREVPLGHQPHMIAADAEQLVSSIRAHLSAHPVTGQGDANGRWISVADRLPDIKLHDQVLCVNVMNKIDLVYASTIVVCVKEAKREGDACFYTYWQPLPAAPMTAASGMDEGK